MRLLLRHRGSGKFVVEVVSEDGGYASSVNTTGRYFGMRAHQVRIDSVPGLVPGPYRIRVQADGPWLIRLWNPVWDGGELPTFEEGIGDNVLTSILLQEGITTLVLTHNGMSNFVVELLSADGHSSELIVDTIGEYDAASTLRVQRGAVGGALEPGLYALVIQADGEWTVEFLE